MSSRPVRLAGFAFALVLASSPLAQTSGGGTSGAGTSGGTGGSTRAGGTTLNRAGQGSTTNRAGTNAGSTTGRLPGTTASGEPASTLNRAGTGDATLNRTGVGETTLNRAGSQDTNLVRSGTSETSLNRGGSPTGDATLNRGGVFGSSDNPVQGLVGSGGTTTNLGGVDVPGQVFRLTEGGMLFRAPAASAGGVAILDPGDVFATAQHGDFLLVETNQGVGFVPTSAFALGGGAAFQGHALIRTDTALLSFPDVSAPSVVLLGTGTSVVIEEVLGDTARVRTALFTGWVPLASFAGGVPGFARLSHAAREASLHEHPRSDATLGGRVPLGSPMVILAREGEWLSTLSEGGLGWLPARVVG